MDRKALIISNPGEVGDKHYFKGVYIDVDKCEKFLLSPIGGYWYSSEIKLLNRPSVSEVRDEVSDLKKYAYSLIIFTGHGWYSADADSTILQLRENQEIDSVELLEGVSKRTIIIDCCSEIYSGTVLSEVRKMEIANTKLVIHPNSCRLSYDKEITESGDGFVMTFSCRSGEKSYGDDEFGSFYIHNLIRKAKGWANSLSLDTEKYYDSKSISEIHELAKEGASRMSGNRQIPRLSQSKDGNSFPFCVVA